MTNFEKIKLIVNQLQFYIEEGLITENECGSVLEEIYSAMEILEDCGAINDGTFKEEMAALEKVKDIK